MFGESTVAEEIVSEIVVRDTSRVVQLVVVSLCLGQVDCDIVV